MTPSKRSPLPPTPPRWPSRSPRTAFVLLVVAALASASIWTTEAAAATGDLHVFSGRTPDGTPATVGPWTNLTNGSPGATGAYGVHFTTVFQGTSVTATLAPPPGLSFASANALRVFSAPASADHSQPQILTSWENLGHPFTGQSSYGGYLGDTGGGAVAVNHPASLVVQLNCVSFDGIPGTCPLTSYSLERLDLTLHDDDAPTVTGSMTGELLDGTWKTAATGRVAVTAADVGSGVYRAFVREGATTWYAAIDPAQTRCRDAYAANGNAYDFVPSALSLVPCRTASADYAPTFDLTALGDGIHSGISLGIEDAGGNERTILAGRTLRINAPGGTLPDAGATGPSGCVYATDGQTCTAAAPSGGGAVRSKVGA